MAITRHWGPRWGVGRGKDVHRRHGRKSATSALEGIERYEVLPELGRAPDASVVEGFDGEGEWEVRDGVRGERQLIGTCRRDSGLQRFRIRSSTGGGLAIGSSWQGQGTSGTCLLDVKEFDSNHSYIEECGAPAGEPLQELLVYTLPPAPAG
ncbi:unnamed protein product [Tuber aestivum]|uniref:Uncharacterized protein n=1 Tax=Tuber aestivum TaxID=59557 RepID=A0A292PW11_9PEZI|nr:unnamed protein product [Tuber aestivum]